MLQLKELELQSARSSQKIKEEQIKNQEEHQHSFQFLQNNNADQNDLSSLGELNMQNLIQQKDDDVMRIKYLQKQNEEYSQRMTVGDVNNFLAGKQHSSAETALTTESQKLAVLNLQQEIEKNMLEMEMLKQGLQVKNQMLNTKPQEVKLKDRPSVANDYFSRPTIFPFFNNNDGSTAIGECGSVTQFLCGMNGPCSGQYGYERPTTSYVSAYPGIDHGELVGNFGSNNFKNAKNNNFDYFGQSSDYALKHGSFEARRSSFRAARQMRQKSPPPLRQYKDPNIMQECSIF